jgi:hypothetical protein
VALWRKFDSTEGSGVVTAYSHDDGLSWSAPALIQNEYGYQPRLTTDGAGTWMAITSLYFTIHLHISRDSGVTWGPLVNLGTHGPNDGPNPDIATDGAGTWMAVWDTTLELAGADQGRSDYDLVASISTDDGETWSEATVIGGRFALGEHGVRETPRVTFVDGVWQVVWVHGYDEGLPIGREGDLMATRSFDGGHTWTDPAALNHNASRDNTSPWQAFPWPGIDFLPEVATNSLGTSILVWTSSNSLEDTIGLDYDVLFARSHTDCPPTPEPGCRVPTTAGASSVSMKNTVGKKDRLKWKWGDGESTLSADLGDPTTTTSYALCIYDDVAGTVRNVFEADLPAAGVCQGASCWSVSGEGLRYRDRVRELGPVSRFSISAGENGRAAFDVKAEGAGLAPPVTPLALNPSTVFQLLNTDNGECWEATFSTARDNTFELFKARSN